MKEAHSIMKKDLSKEHNPRSIRNAEMCGDTKAAQGDVDWSYDYHRMMNTFRKYPEIAGWLYTEHHDVINEWNGYWRFDRTNKFTGVEDIFPGMKVNDFHTPVYLSTGNEICKTVNGGEKVEIPLFLSSMTDADYGNQLKLTYQLSPYQLHRRIGCNFERITPS